MKLLSTRVSKCLGAAMWPGDGSGTLFTIQLDRGERFVLARLRPVNGLVANFQQAHQRTPSELTESRLTSESCSNAFCFLYLIKHF